MHYKRITFSFFPIASAILILLITVPMQVSAQLDKKSKKNVVKATKLAKKGKYDKASEKMEAVLNQYPVNETLWKIYQEIKYEDYRENYDPNIGFKIEVKDGGDADEALIAAMEQSLMAVLNKPKSDYLNAVNLASMCVPYNYNSSIMMRKQYIDDRYWSPKNVSEESIKWFKEAETYFGKKNYEKALTYYRKSFEADTTNYQAYLYMGDSYYAMKYYGEAAEFFRIAAAKQPRLIEPAKYLADCYKYKGEYEKALDEIKQCFFIYPDESLFLSLTGFLPKLGKKLDRNWVLRLAPINNTTNQYNRRNIFTDPLHFKHYTAALTQLNESYDENGLLKSDTTTSKYLEIESWRYMLKMTEGEDIPSLEYARKMDKLGLLEPYIFINLFNVDLYEQYLDYIQSNPQKVKRYIDNYLIVNN
jgi:tetratricopeptide (TPR) repeat protein